MLEIFYTNQFKKDFKKAKKQGKNLEKLKEVLVLLQEQQTLPPKYKDHALTGNYIGTRECLLFGFSYIILGWLPCL
ncbi:hypothetical protein CUN42_14580 [Enterococcus faecalis]|nr:hypothetical protein CUN42_14580 [Enterococcus faecalis]